MLGVEQTYACISRGFVAFLLQNLGDQFSLDVAVRIPRTVVVGMHAREYRRNDDWSEA